MEICVCVCFIFCVSFTLRDHAVIRALHLKSRCHSPTRKVIDAYTVDGIADFYIKIFFRAETLRKQNGDEPQHVNRASRSLLSVVRMVADNLHFLKAKERLKVALNIGNTFCTAINQRTLMA